MGAAFYVAPMKHNTYFNGAVQSLGFTHEKGEATLGVMEPGEYEFGTGAPERMDIISGTIEAKLPGGEWQSYAGGQTFNVPGNSKFNVRARTQIAYACWFV